MIYLPFEVSYGTNLTEEPKVLSAQFGDGYRQSLTDGINFNKQKWSIQFDVQTDANAELILEFFRTLRGTTPFIWTIPNSAWSVTGAGIGVGDGVRTQYQLQRTGRGSVAVDSWSGVWPTYTTPRTNRIPYSADLTQAAWTKVNGGTGVVPVVTGNYGLAPDGTLTADRVVCQNGAGATGSDYSVVKIADVVGAMPPNQRTTRSVWVKSNTGNNLAASLGSNGTSVSITIMPTWTRVPMTYYHPTLTLTHTIDLGLVGNVAGNTNSTIDFLVWEGQLEEGLFATANIHTDATAVTVTPDYWFSTTSPFKPVQSFNQPVDVYRKDWQGNQLMYATARTNLALWAEDLSNAVWFKGSITVTTDSVAAPDGANTADRAVEVAANTYHYAAQTISRSGAAGDIYTSSIYLKAGERTRAQFQNDAIGFATVNANIDLTAGTIAKAGTNQPITVVLTPLSGGWYRASVTYVSISAYTEISNLWIINDGVVGYGAPYLGDITKGIYYWGLQVDSGTVATAYIPTTSAAVTVTDYTLTDKGLVTFSTPPLGPNATLGYPAGAVISFTASGTDRRQFIAKNWRRSYSNYSNNQVSVEFEEDFS